MPDIAEQLARPGRASLAAGGFSVDLTVGMAPLTFDRNANPDGVAPAIVLDQGRPALRLSVQQGAWPHATAGEPRTCDRCEVREPDKTPIGVATIHRFAVRVPEDFPCAPRRCVVAQLKGNDGLSPLFALRIVAGRFFADWRLPGVTIEHHDGLPSRIGRWLAIELRFGPGDASLLVDGAIITRARADFGPPWRKRFLKLGPYRDRHPDWGSAPAAVLFRDIERSVCP